ncbi:MAG: bifunctional heptose 7-phosphate kinase/heptose 1-phosphate adenyltransferase [Chitinophagaceae bacterium]
MDFRKLFDSFKDIQIGVIGDVMLDTYMWGNVDRISPEAPVPIVSLQKKDYRIGGAGNVALNLAALGCKVSIMGVIGEDNDGTILKDMFTHVGIDAHGLISSQHRITTNKMRVMSRNQQMLRLDSEMVKDLNKEEEMKLVQEVKQYLETQKPSVMIFEDYDKGVLNKSVIQQILSLCQSKNIITAVDPKHKNFFSYTGVDIFKPNFKEVREGLLLNDEKINEETLGIIHSKLHDKLEHSISLITLSEKGAYFNNGTVSGLIPSHVRNIADVSGAGDTVIAVASLIYASTRNVELMTAVSNIAGGLVCEEVGTVAINCERLLEECEIVL